MLKIIVHGLLARKFRLVTTALAVTLGVAFMAGTLVLTDTFGQTFNDLSAGVYKSTDAVVRATATGFGAADSPGGASVVLFTTPAAQQLVAAPGKYSSIVFVAKHGVSQQQLVSSLKQAIPHGTEAITGAAQTKELQNQFQTMPAPR